MRNYARLVSEFPDDSEIFRSLHAQFLTLLLVGGALSMGGVVSYCAGGVILAWGTVGGGLPRVKLSLPWNRACHLGSYRRDTQRVTKPRLRDRKLGA